MSVNHIEQVLEATAHKTAAVLSPTTHHDNYPIEMGGERGSGRYVLAVQHDDDMTVCKQIIIK